MAKQKSFIKLNGTFDDKTFVDSKTYGDHVRKPRGTHKPAVLNDAYQESSDALVSANVPAKMIKDAIDPFRKNFYDGLLWTRLVSHFKTGVNKNAKPDFLTLVDFDIHSKNRLSRISKISASLSHNSEGNTLSIALETIVFSKFRNKKIDGCKLTVIAVFPNLQTKGAKAIETILPVIPLEKANTKQFDIPVWEGADAVLICVKAEGCEKGVPSAVFKTKGMAILAGMDLKL
jgi:hypothetical protein